MTDKPQIPTGLNIPNGGYSDDLRVRIFQYLNEIAPHVDHLSAGECDQLTDGICALIRPVSTPGPSDEARFNVEFNCPNCGDLINVNNGKPGDVGFVASRIDSAPATPTTGASNLSMDGDVTENPGKADGFRSCTCNMPTGVHADKCPHVSAQGETDD